MDEKEKQLDQETKGSGEHLTTNQGARISDNQNSLRAGSRGPTLMEDFIFREKITHFDHERIPERVVHARGAGAHGYFQPYESQADITKAGFLQDPGKAIPVFVRFSTVAGFRGSADTARDVRGFAVKFYTDEGIFDLVGNNIPVFFIQDAIKFPDLIHSVKPEPHNEIPQAASAHDTFYDFISLVPESMHMMMWVMSDRAIPRSFSMMEGFGIHTFRMINEKGESHFVKFHWKPVLGTHSLVWNEAQTIAGKDPDFHRRDLWESIEDGNFPEYEFGVQVIREDEEFRFDFDILDATKLWPEEEVPVRKIGKMVLNRNPDNYFAETEQVAFHPGHIVPGIDFSNDPLLQGRLFSYTDTQLIRLGGPNFAEIPINRPTCPVHNNQRDGYMRQTINKGRVSYEPNSLAQGCPMQNPENLKGFVSYAEKMDGVKVRERSESFKDHYTQATLFWNSMTAVEKQHIIDAFSFELSMVDHMHIRERMVDHLNHIHMDLATGVAENIGVAPPTATKAKDYDKKSPALSLENTRKNTIKGRKVAILVAEGFNGKEVMQVKDYLTKAGAKAEIITKVLGKVKDKDGKAMEADKTLLSAPSVKYDAVYIPGGQKSVEALQQQGDALHFVNEAFKHCKPIAATGEGCDFLKASAITGVDIADEGSTDLVAEKGVLSMREGASLDNFSRKFEEAIARHRHWEREKKDKVPA